MQERPPFRGWNRAFAFVAGHHGAALRKGTRIPYVTHVVAVAETLAYHYPDRDDLVVAGLLHDVVEDTDATFTTVAETFGAAVERLVRAVSKDDAAMEAALGTDLEALTAGLDDAAAARRLWRARREFMLSHVRGTDVEPDVLRLKAADAHANLSSIERDLRDPLVGAGAWSRFAVGRDESLWYYREVARAVRAGLADEPLVGRLEAILTTVVRTSAAAVAPRGAPDGGATVRIGSLGDVDAVAPLLDAYRRFYGRPADAATAHAYLVERLARGEATLLVADDTASRAIGFVALFPGHSTVRAAPIVVLNDLFVVPEARGRGTGRLLMETAVDVARAMGAAKLQLKTATTNAPAQALYASLGWRRVDDFHEYEYDLERYGERRAPSDDAARSA